MTATPHTPPPQYDEMQVDLPEHLDLWHHHWPNKSGLWLVKNRDTGEVRLIPVGEHFSSTERAAYYGPISL